MLVYGHTLVLGYLAHGPWKDPHGLQILRRPKRSRRSRRSRLMQGRASIIAAGATAAALWVFQFRTAPSRWADAIGRAMPRAGAVDGG